MGRRRVDNAAILRGSSWPWREAEGSLGLQPSLTGDCAGLLLAAQGTQAAACHKRSVFPLPRASRQGLTKHKSEGEAACAAILFNYSSPDCSFVQTRGLGFPPGSEHSVFFSHLTKHLPDASTGTESPTFSQSKMH